MATRKYLIFTPVLMALLGVVGLGGCSDGVSTQEAYAACKIEQDNSPNVLETSFQSCVACQEECGDQCMAEGKSPEEYACPPSK